MLWCHGYAFLSVFNYQIACKHPLLTFNFTLCTIEVALTFCDDSTGLHKDSIPGAQLFHGISGYPGHHLEFLFELLFITAVYECWVFLSPHDSDIAPYPGCYLTFFECEGELVGIWIPVPYSVELFVGIIRVIGFESTDHAASPGD